MNVFSKIKTIFVNQKHQIVIKIKIKFVRILIVIQNTNSLIFLITLKVPDTTDNNTTTLLSPLLSESFRVLDTYSRDEVKEHIRWYMIGMAVVAVSVFIGFLVYFPDKPPSPPSATSALPR